VAALLINPSSLPHKAIHPPRRMPGSLSQSHIPRRPPSSQTQHFRSPSGFPFPSSIAQSFTLVRLACLSQRAVTCMLFAAAIGTSPQRPHYLSLPPNHRCRLHLPAPINARFMARSKGKVSANTPRSTAATRQTVDILTASQSVPGTSAAVSGPARHPIAVETPGAPPSALTCTQDFSTTSVHGAMLRAKPIAYLHQAVQFERTASVLRRSAADLPILPVPSQCTAESARTLARPYTTSPRSAYRDAESTRRCTPPRQAAIRAAAIISGESRMPPPKRMTVVADEEGEI
jgi:hypothetical protein